MQQRSILSGRSPFAPIVVGLAWASITSGCSSYFPLGSVGEKELGLDSAAAYAGPLDAPAFSAPTAENTALAMVSVGDLDGDGHDDMASVSYDQATHAGTVHIWYGGARPESTAEAEAFAQPDALLGYALGSDSAYPLFTQVGSAGDFDADGYADLWVNTGSCHDTPQPAGTYLIYGGPGRLGILQPLESVAVHFVPAYLPDTAGEFCESGAALAPGDLDGDGIDDLVLAAVEEPREPLHPHGKEGLYVFYGRTERLSGEVLQEDADAWLHAAREHLTWPAGDLNGDGFDDLLAAEAWGRDHRTFLLRGNGQRWSGRLELEDMATGLDGAWPYSQLGKVTPSDFDGDGFDDLLLTDAEERPHLFYGAPDSFEAGFDLQAANAQFETTRGNFEHETRQLPFSVGDRDGDGATDLGVYFGRYQAPSDVALMSGGQRFSGAVRGPDEAVAAQRPHGLYGDGRELFHLVPAGDLDGDGTGDVITISAVLSTETAPVDFRLHVHYGRPGGFGELPTIH